MCIDLPQRSSHPSARQGYGITILLLRPNLIIITFYITNTNQWLKVSRSVPSEQHWAWQFHISLQSTCCELVAVVRVLASGRRRRRRQRGYGLLRALLSPDNKTTFYNYANHSNRLGSVDVLMLPQSSGSSSVVQISSKFFLNLSN